MFFLSIQNDIKVNPENILTKRMFAIHNKQTCSI